MTQQYESVGDLRTAPVQNLRVRSIDNLRIFHRKALRSHLIVLEGAKMRVHGRCSSARQLGPTLRESCRSVSTWQCNIHCRRRNQLGSQKHVQCSARASAAASAVEEKASDESATSSSSMPQSIPKEQTVLLQGALEDLRMFRRFAGRKELPSTRHLPSLNSWQIWPAFSGASIFDYCQQS